MRSFLGKHLSLVKAYFRISFKEFSEYKFNVVTNTVSQILLLVVWALFWNVLLANVKVLGDWSFPMAVLLNGFLMVSFACWQLVWASISLYYDIPSGNLDLYLVRPVNPIFGMIMKELQLMCVFPLVIGLSVVVVAFVQFFEFSLLKLFLALFVCVCGSVILTLAYVFIGILSFWLGKSISFRSFYRTFLAAKEYPVSFFPSFLESFLTFFVPIGLFGTLPVFVLVKFDLVSSLWTVLSAFLAVVVWWLVCVWLWRRGLRRYESQGG